MGPRARHMCAFVCVCLKLAYPVPIVGELCTRMARRPETGGAGQLYKLPTARYFTYRRGVYTKKKCGIRGIMDRPYGNVNLITAPGSPRYQIQAHKGDVKLTITRPWRSVATVP